MSRARVHLSQQAGDHGAGETEAGVRRVRRGAVLGREHWRWSGSARYGAGMGIHASAGIGDSRMSPRARRRRGSALGRWASTVRTRRRRRRGDNVCAHGEMWSQKGQSSSPPGIREAGSHTVLSASSSGHPRGWWYERRRRRPCTFTRTVSTWDRAGRGSAGAEGGEAGESGSTVLLSDAVCVAEIRPEGRPPWCCVGVRGPSCW